MELEKLLQEKKEYTSRIIWLSAKMIGMFIIPIFAAWGIHKLWNINVLLLMFCAFVLSWVSVISLYRKVTLHLRKLDERINSLRKEHDNITVQSTVLPDDTKL